MGIRLIIRFIRYHLENLEFVINFPKSLMEPVYKSNVGRKERCYLCGGKID